MNKVRSLKTLKKMQIDGNNVNIFFKKSNIKKIC